jgi:hypothetical protein
MRKLLMITAAAVCIAAPASAETFNYACHVKDDYHLFAAKVDTTKNTLTWKGSVYKNLVANHDCARMGWRATGKNARALLCVATQGVADLTINYGGPGTDGVEELDCDQVR